MAATSTRRRSPGWGLGRALLGSITRPRTTFARLARERRLDLALELTLVYGLLYAGTAAVLARNHRKPVVRPVVPIPEHRYYAWQTLFTLPVVTAGWGILSTASWMTLRTAGREVDLRTCAVVLAFGAQVPWAVGMWVPETVVAAFFPDYWGAPEGSPPVIGWIGSSYLWAVTAWALGLSATALRYGTGTDWPRSVVAAAAGIVTSTGIQMIPIR